ncbi:single-stranded DNA-binding protein [Vandammella animalimorsus]|uniref:Single-stranded DNA-binding protein n=1 Tax=Vandammella animalimorsus TaxID=2029117 RepID=A0A2A2T4T3_9BURK|nr:single-stranded DNA-binding protein [Vandammella animalimorsus]PAT31850.1 single-stranded DNA-binding protein [Vandammella animalimorsus]PAX16503.1 single-stranded DNA-binding protein [Vandammella animalimorsus]PAX18918.1 single-stranded DNA-binding protein [Vandammella animalimorsus]
MSDLNQCTFIGRLGRDPETRTFPNGDQIASASIAVSETWKDKHTSERQERTQWIPLVFTGKLAEIAAQYLRKGSQVCVSGKWRTRTWKDQQSGQDRRTTEIRVENMQMLGGRQDGQQQHQSQPAATAQQQTDFEEDDIPF